MCPQSSNNEDPTTEWPNGQPLPTAAAPPLVHAVPQYQHEGYYPIYYPPPGAFIPHPHNGQLVPDGSLLHPNDPIMPCYIPTGTFPPSSYLVYPHAGPPPAASAPQRSPPQSTSAVIQQPDVQLQRINPADMA